MHTAISPIMHMAPIHRACGSRALRALSNCRTELALRTSWATRSKARQKLPKPEFFRGDLEGLGTTGSRFSGARRRGDPMQRAKGPDPLGASPQGFG